MTELVQTALYGLDQSPFLFYLSVFLFSLLVGSFLNVVIYRLPIIMERQFTEDCKTYLNQTVTTDEKDKPLNLAFPGSHCPQCQKKIKAWENVPLISYLFLRGKCRHCKKRISIQYPGVELLTALLSVVISVHFGFSWQTLAGLFLTWALIAISGIDMKVRLIPDAISLPILWLGLLLSTLSLYISPSKAILGAALGYLSLWSVYHLFKLLTGKEGMGYGDFKLLALLGAWTGPSGLPIIIIVSSLLGSIVGVSQILFFGHDKSTPMPFGPYLAIAGWITFIWKAPIINTYLQQLI